MYIVLQWGGVRDRAGRSLSNGFTHSMVHHTRQRVRDQAGVYFSNGFALGSSHTWHSDCKMQGQARGAVSSGRMDVKLTVYHRTHYPQAACGKFAFMT